MVLPASLFCLNWFDEDFQRRRSPLADTDEMQSGNFGYGQVLPHSSEAIDLVTTRSLIRHFLQADNASESTA